MRRIFIFTALAAGITATGTILLPRDGDRVTVQPVQFIDPMADNENGMWDFSSLDVIGNNVEWRYDYAVPDTLLCETRPGVRRDYMVTGDTVWHVCSESSNLRICIDPPATASPIVNQSNFNEHARYYQSQFFSGSGAASACIVATGTVLLPHGDRLKGVKLLYRHSAMLRTPLKFTPQPCPDIDSADSTLTLRTEDVYTWISPALRYPLAETRIITDSIAGEEYSRDLSSWLILPSDQPYEPELSIIYNELTAPSNDIGNQTLDDTNSPIPSAEKIRVSMNGDMAEASFIAQSDGIAEMILADILGRVYAYSPSRQVSAGEYVEFSVNTAGLPPGDYILKFHSGPDNPPVLVKIIKP